MTITNQEYAEMAMKANEEGKELKVIKGKLVLVDPEPIQLSDEQVIAQNKALKIALINEANENISILQDATDLDMAEDGDEEKLKAWKKYRVLLNRIDASDINVIFPEKPELS